MQNVESPISTSPLLNETELSQRWGISIRTLQQSRWRGVGCPYVKIGRLVRYRFSDIEAYEASRTHYVALDAAESMRNLANG